ncbi:hypothetical protein FB446DRAFT_784644 [Lentinula raphanica]|nr:hypothetical protein FB446DRAFT_784644 [Lentinula raphanica]
MGTDGFRVYRYQGYFFTWYTTNSSYEDCLGLTVAGEIPRDPASFEAFVASKKAELQQILDSELINGSDIKPKPPFYGHHNEDYVWFENFQFLFRLRKKPPVDGWYRYEIDLDNFIFYFQGEPMFDIRNMPDEDQFLSYLSDNTRACDVAKEHRFKIPSPVAVQSSILDAYKGFGTRCTDLHTVLGVNPQPNRLESTRIQIMEMFILASTAAVFMNNTYGVGINAIFSNPIPKQLIRRLHSTCDLFSSPLIFHNSPYFWNWPLHRRVRKGYIIVDYARPRTFSWIDEEYFCDLVVQRLDTEHTLQAAIVSLSEQVTASFKDKECMNKSIIYGAILSLYDICIVRLRVVDHDGERVVQVESHTPTLQFLPRTRFHNMFTPGIEALSRLGNLVYKNHLQRKLIAERDAQHGSGGRLLPTEICLQIAQYLPYYTITDLALVSPQWAYVAIEMLQHPFFLMKSSYWRQPPDCYRILPPLRQYSPTEEWLFTRSFQALDHDGREVTVHLTPDVKTKLERREDTYDLGDGFRLQDGHDKPCQIRLYIGET